MSLFDYTWDPSWQLVTAVPAAPGWRVYALDADVPQLLWKVAVAAWLVEEQVPYASGTLFAGPGVPRRRVVAGIVRGSAGMGGPELQAADALAGFWEIRQPDWPEPTPVEVRAEWLRRGHELPPELRERR